MKRLAIAIAVLAVILAAGKAEGNYVEHGVADPEERINALEAGIKTPPDDAPGEVRGVADWGGDKSQKTGTFR